MKQTIVIIEDNEIRDVKRITKLTEDTFIVDCYPVKQQKPCPVCGSETIEEKLEPIMKF